MGVGGSRASRQSSRRCESASLHSTSSGPLPATVTPANAVTVVDCSILDTKLQRDYLRQRRQCFRRRVTNELQTAAQWWRKGRLDLALAALHQQQRWVEMIGSIDDALLLVERQLLALEGAQLQQAVAIALDVSTAALRAIRNELPVDTVASLVKEAEEHRLHFAAVTAAMAIPSSTPVTAIAAADSEKRGDNFFKCLSEEDKALVAELEHLVREEDEREKRRRADTSYSVVPLAAPLAELQEQVTGALMNDGKVGRGEDGRQACFLSGLP